MGGPMIGSGKKRLSNSREKKFIPLFVIKYIFIKYLFNLFYSNYFIISYLYFYNYN